MLIKTAKLEERIRTASAAFSLVEVLVGLAILATMFISLYAGFSYGFGVIQLTRENLRATQILQEKMETLRLYTWDQINTPGFIPSSFTEPFYADSSNIVQGSLIYTGTVEIAATTLPESYNADLREVTVTLQWDSGGLPRTREISTFVTRHGLQNYIY